MPSSRSRRLKLDWTLVAYRAIEFLQATTIASAFVPMYLGSKVPSTPENDFGGMIPAKFADYVIAVISVSLLFLVRRMKNGPNEREGLLHLFIVTAGLLVTALLFPLMYFALPPAVVGVGIYNVTVVEITIRGLKPAA